MNKGITHRGFLEMAVETVTQRKMEDSSVKEESSISVLMKDFPVSPSEYEQVLTRQKAAAILHYLVKNYLQEADEENLSPALELQDLYDCHTCVDHVAQIYVKGIMEAFTDKPLTFGMREPVTEAQGYTYLEKALDVKARTPKTAIPEQEGPVKVAFTELEAFWENHPEACFVDVRSVAERERKRINTGKLPFRNIPLAQILKNPYIVTEDLGKPILFICEEGYQSRIAAGLAWDNGFRKVFYAGAEEF